MEERSGYLYARVRGEESFETSQAYWQELLQYCRTHEVERLLVDEYLDGVLTETDIYRLVAPLAEEASVLGVKVAVVDRNQEHALINRFGVQIARNRRVLVQSFSDFDSAEQWLLEHGG